VILCHWASSSLRLRSKKYARYWRQRHHSSLKHWELLAQQQTATSQKTWIFSSAAVRTSNPAMMPLSEPVIWGETEAVFQWQMILCQKFSLRNSVIGMKTSAQCLSDLYFTKDCRYFRRQYGWASTSLPKHFWWPSINHFIFTNCKKANKVGIIWNIISSWNVSSIPKTGAYQSFKLKGTDIPV